MSTKSVRLDNELMNTLAEQRNGFETPNECLKRLLTQHGCVIKKDDEEEEDETS